MSWDTDSDAEDLDFDEKIINNIQEDFSDDDDHVKERNIMDEYDPALHCFKRTYVKESAYENKKVKEIF